MGLFSSKIKYYAYAGSSPLFEEDKLPATVKSTLLQAAIGNKSMSEGIKYALATDMYARAKKMISYALRELNPYVRGLPETNQNIIAIDQTDIIAAIEDEIGEPIDAIVIRWGDFQERFFVARDIHDNYLNPAYFPWPSGDPLDTTWDIEGTSNEIPVVNPSTGAYYTATGFPDYLRVGTSYNYTITFHYVDNLGSPQTWVMPIPLDLNYYPGKDWIMVEYYSSGDTEDHKFWAYEIGSGGNPILDDQISTESINMQYLPVCILMRDKVWYDEPPDTSLHITTDKMLKKLAIKGKEIKEDFLEQKAEDDASGDPARSNAETWDFFIHFGVPIHSNVRGSREYIFHFLRFLETLGSWTTFADYQTFLAGGGVQPESNLNVVEGELIGYNVWYGWSYIYSVTHAGVYTPTGGQPLVARRMYSKVYEFGTPGYAAGIYEVHGSGTPIATSESDTAFHDYAVFTRQNDEDTYTQVLVMAPSMMYQVNTSETGDFRFRYVDVELFPEDLELESEFRYPVHIGSLKETSSMHREEMLADGLTGTVYLVQEVKVKWYQTGFFKWLIIIVAIILIVLSIIYPGFLYVASGLLSTALGGGAVLAFIIFTVLVFAVGFIISMAAGLIGGTWGTVFMVVAMVAMAYSGQQAGSVGMAGSTSTAMTSTAWGSAINMINTVTPYIQAAQVAYNAYATNKLEADLRDFLKTGREKQQQLQDAWDALGPMPTWLDPMDLIRVQSSTALLESPSNFIERTLNPNPGMLGYELINEFATLALALPENGSNTNMLEDMFQAFERQRGIA